MFDRLYHDAMHRITRMEELRLKFVQMQKIQIYSMAQEEEDSGAYLCCRGSWGIDNCLLFETRE